MMSREAIQKAMQDRILSVICDTTGITRPTLMKLRDNKGKVSISIQHHISHYLGGTDESKDGA